MRLIIADDSGLYRDLLVHLLDGDDREVVATTGDADELIALTEIHAPDIVLTDIRMPPRFRDDGLRAGLHLRARHPGLGIVLLSLHGEIEYATQLVRALGQRAGYLLKERATGSRELLDALDRVAAGGLVIDPDIVTRLLNRPRDDNPLHQLTERERATLRLMAEGLSNAAIAEQLAVTPSTIEKRGTVLFRKLGLTVNPSSAENLRVRAVLEYLRHTNRMR